MRSMLLSSAFASAALLLGSATALAADTAHPSATFHVDSMTAIPGHTLSPGDYTIRVVDHLSDRYVLRVDGPGGEHTIFLGIPKAALPHKKGEILWTDPADGATYVRGWEFAGMGSPLEFVYPKNDAVAVAKANSAQVPAIDPESDGIVAKTALTKDQAQMVTLWLLTPTAVGPSAPAGISAQKLKEVANVERPPMVKHLPRTGSDLPLFWLFGTLALGGAAGLRLFRFSNTRT